MNIITILWLNVSAIYIWRWHWFSPTSNIDVIDITTQICIFKQILLILFHFVFHVKSKMPFSFIFQPMILIIFTLNSSKGKIIIIKLKKTNDFLYYLMKWTSSNAYIHIFYNILQWKVVDQMYITHTVVSKKDFAQLQKKERVLSDSIRLKKNAVRTHFVRP